MHRDLSIHTPHGLLQGQLDIPENPRGLVLLARAHHAPIDLFIASQLNDQGFAVLAMELLTSQEAQFVDATHNVPRLTQRLLELLDMIRQDGDMENLPLGIYAAGDSTPAAIRAAAQRDTQIKALAYHGGLIDRAGLQALKLLTAPLLAIFNTDDELGRIAFKRALAHLACHQQTDILEPGGDPLPKAIQWFSHYLVA